VGRASATGGEISVTAINAAISRARWLRTVIPDLPSALLRPARFACAGAPNLTDRGLPAIQQGGSRC
jgi:hypothetical protein